VEQGVAFLKFSLLLWAGLGSPARVFSGVERPVMESPRVVLAWPGIDAVGKGEKVCNCAGAVQRQCGLAAGLRGGMGEGQGG